MGRKHPHKMHIHTREPVTAQSPKGLLVEAMCERYCLRPFVMSPAQYQGWVQMGLTQEIFCTRCLQNIPPSLREAAAAATPALAPSQAD